jgi:hypothetical protein
MGELPYMDFWNTNKIEIEIEIKVGHLHCVMWCELCTTTQENLLTHEKEQYNGQYLMCS